MTEARETPILTKSPLGDTHLRLGATMIDRDGWSVPQSYGDVLLEYAAMREGGAGLIDLSPRGRILVSGSEAVQFLNGLITNDMKTLAVNSWMTAAFPNVQGRLIASVRVVRLNDEGTDKNVCPTFLIDTEAVTHQSVLKTIERFTLAGDFHVKDITSQTALISVQGKKAACIVRAVLGDAASELDRNAAREWHGSHSLGAQASCLLFGGKDNPEPEDHDRNARANHALWEPGCWAIIRASHTDENGFDLIVASNQAAGLWNALQNAGARPVGYDALEILRIEAGQPRYGVDMDETNVVTESLDDAVSYTKGCYVGQEIIARIKLRKLKRAR
jgi:folate-binding protein YgfZ